MFPSVPDIYITTQDYQLWHITDIGKFTLLQSELQHSVTKWKGMHVFIMELLSYNPMEIVFKSFMYACMPVNLYISVCVPVFQNLNTYPLYIHSVILPPIITFPCILQSIHLAASLSIHVPAYACTSIHLLILFQRWFFFTIQESQNHLCQAEWRQIQFYHGWESWGIITRWSGR